MKVRNRRAKQLVMAVFISLAAVGCGSLGQVKQSLDGAQKGVLYTTANKFQRVSGTVVNESNLDTEYRDAFNQMALGQTDRTAPL